MRRGTYRGSQQLTASADYTSSTQTATVTAGQVSTLNFTLTASTLASIRAPGITAVRPRARLRRSG